MLCQLLPSSGPDSSLRQPIGSHGANRPESECVGVETTVECSAVVGSSPAEVWVIPVPPAKGSAATATPPAPANGPEGSNRARGVNSGVCKNSSTVQTWSASPNAIAGVRKRGLSPEIRSLSV